MSALSSEAAEAADYQKCNIVDRYALASDSTMALALRLQTGPDVGVLRFAPSSLNEVH